MKITGVAPRDIYITVEFPLTEVKLLLDLFDSLELKPTAQLKLTSNLEVLRKFIDELDKVCRTVEGENYNVIG